MSTARKYKQVASYTELVPSSPSTAKLDTSSIFFEVAAYQGLSPIDCFIQDTSKLNVFLLTSGSLSLEQRLQLLLSYCASFERYIRLLLRGLINLDSDIEAKFHEKQVTFVSAIRSKRQHLPEALFDQTSLMSSKDLKGSISNSNGIVISNFFETGAPKELLEQFEKVCQLRHCAIHRHGFLSPHAAFKLGIEKHFDLIDYRMDLGVETLMEISDILISLVNVINNGAFQFCIEKKRPFREKPTISYSWTWDYKKDKAEFSKYYKLFASKLNSPPTLGLRTIYLAFKKENDKRKK